MRPRDEAKENLVREKAMEMLVKEGFDGFSMQKLAKAAGVSPATLYIYYKDKDDLIIKLGIEEGKRFTDAVLHNFDPKMSFAEGLRKQWENRARFNLENSMASCFFEQIKHTPYRDRIMSAITSDFAKVMGEFMHNAIANKEITPMPLEVAWSIMYAPLYNLVRFHQEGTSIGGRPFTWDDKLMNQTLELVLKAVKPE